MEDGVRSKGRGQGSRARVEGKGKGSWLAYLDRCRQDSLEQSKPGYVRGTCQSSPNRARRVKGTGRRAMGRLTPPLACPSWCVSPMWSERRGQHACRSPEAVWPLGDGGCSRAPTVRHLTESRFTKFTNHVSARPARLKAGPTTSRLLPAVCLSACLLVC